MISEDIFFEIIEKADFSTMRKLCQTNKKFYNLCKTHSKKIERIKCKALNKMLKENDKEIRIYAMNNKYSFDDISKNESVKLNGISTVYDKIWVKLMFLLNKKYFEEAESLVVCSKLPEPYIGLFFEKEFEKMPIKIMNLLLDQLSSLLEISGYDNVDDFIEDYPIDTFKHKAVKNAISKML